MKKISQLFILIIIALICFSCSEKKDFPEVPTHPDGWVDQQSEQFHGKAALEGGTDQCASCHGQNYSGGPSDVSCYGSGCHISFPHPDGFAAISSPNFHGEFLKTQLNWNILQCKTCHGSNYAGGNTGVSCRECHVGANGPEQCNTCHGSDLNNAPPRDLNNNFSQDSLGVGVHQKHVATTVITNVYNCDACHVSVKNFSDPMHIDNTPGAQMLFSSLATDNGRLNTSYDASTGTCGDVYCHGSFVFVYDTLTIVGKNRTVSWTSENTEGCRYCHGLPPQGHAGQDIFIDPRSCALCHVSVVNPDGTIKDKRKHINGRVDVF